MTGAGAGRPDLFYWVASLLLLLWAAAYAWLAYYSFAVSSPENLTALVERGIIKEAYADYIARIPDWVRALTVFLAAMRLAGAIGLLLRRSWTTSVYAVAFVATLVIMYRGFFIADAASVIRTSQIFVEIGFIIVSIFAVWFAYKNRPAQHAQ